MRRLLVLLPLVLLLAAVAATTPASANPNVMFSVMMDDDHLLYRGDDMRDDTLKRMKRLGVDYVRVTVLWSVVAERAKKGRKRRKRFDPSDPRTYPRGNWDRYDRLVQAGKTLGIGVYLNVTGPGPRWAHRKAPRSMRRYRRSWEPNPREYFKFVKAVGRRYDGTYRDENDGRRTLPRVSFWSIYNEPNQQGWLTPQYKRGIPWSPVIYRDLWYYGRAALDATGHKNDIVLIGETAPLGSSQRNTPSPIYPKRFIREFFCVDSSNRPYTGASAKRRRCETLEKIRRQGLRYTAWAHHPYTKFLAPTERDKARDAITVANISEMWTLLDVIGPRTGLQPAGTRNLVAMTEFGYETDPPDPFSGISPALQAEYINVGDYIAYKDPRVIANTQFLLRDVEGVRRYRRSNKKHWFTYQSGLHYADGRPKPALAAYAFPLVITGKGASQAGEPGVTFWGWPRFLPIVPAGQQHVHLQFRPQGATNFTTIGDAVPINSPLGFFEAHRAMTAPGTWRAVWTEAASKTQIFSREVEFKG